MFKNSIVAHLYLFLPLSPAVAFTGFVQVQLRKSVLTPA